MKREYYFNPDFDATLTGAASRLEEGGFNYVQEMGMHFLFAATAQDSLILYAPLPEDFLGYLEAKGLAVPRLVRHPAFTPDALFTPFGWNAHTVSLNLRYDHPALHPDLDTVRRVNGKDWAWALEREWREEAPEAPFESRLCSTLEQAEDWIKASPGLWVAKGVHGHAGIGNCRLSALDEPERLALQALLAEHGQVVLEPWQNRVSDLGVHFSVQARGGIADLRGHELINSRDGAFLGVRINPGATIPAPWQEPLEKAARMAGQALAEAGYYGPVSLDAYVWEAGTGLRLRPWVDINARLSMAVPAHGLARRLPGKHLLWTWFSARKLDLPAGYAELDARLGDHAYRKGAAGILVTSPLALDGVDAGTWAGKGDRPGRLRPKRVGFLLCADREGDLTTLRQALIRSMKKAA